MYNQQYLDCENNIWQMFIMNAVVVCFCELYTSEINYGNFHLLRIMNDLNI
jgi:hypothetical protein